MLLAIETSCDETAVAVFRLNDFAERNSLQENLVADCIGSQVTLHRPYGGVVPELAARAHIANLPVLVEQALGDAKCTVKDLQAIVVTGGPGLKGCLLVGLSFAKAVSFASRIPLIVANHLEGHIAAGDLVGGIAYPLLSLVVSGGHTLLVESEDFRKYRVVANTRDDAAGEAFDKIATLLGLPYPGGPHLSALAAEGDSTRFVFPQPVRNDPASFSFSGLKTAAMRRVQALGEERHDLQTKRDLAAGVEQLIVESLVQKSLAACAVTKPKSFLLTGGVAANAKLRTRLASELSRIGVPLVLPPPRWCTDNAAMIGALGLRIYNSRRDEFESWDRSSVVPEFLGPGVPLEVDARAKWPLGID